MQSLPPILQDLCDRPPSSLEKIADINEDLKILVVEDNRVVQFAIKSMLNKLGYNFDIAGDGISAIDLANKNRGYFLVLMDIGLPDISGIQVTTTLLSLENTKNVPIVAMTSHTERQYIEQCYMVGMVGFYNKPKHIGDILKIIENHVPPDFSLV